jgi:hypothetical protein
VEKHLFLDVMKALTDNGISDIHIPAKLEGIAFGQKVTVDGVVKHTLYVASDNDFLATVKDKNDVTVDNPNRFFVFAFSDADLAGFVPQTFQGVPLRRRG